MAEHPFIDPVADAPCTLTIDGDGMLGVTHPDCDQAADVSIHLDAFYCQTCKWNGRISGAWAVDKLEELDRAAIAADMATAHTDDTHALVVGFTSTTGTGVLIHQVPAVSIDGRTIVILRDDEEPDEDGVQGWLLLDTDDTGGAYTLDGIKAWAQELADDPGMDAFQADRDLWATVAAIVEQAEQTMPTNNPGEPR